MPHEKTKYTKYQDDQKPSEQSFAVTVTTLHDTHCRFRGFGLVTYGINLRHSMRVIGGRAELMSHKPSYPFS